MAPSACCYCPASWNLYVPRVDSVSNWAFACCKSIYFANRPFSPNHILSTTNAIDSSALPSPFVSFVPYWQYVDLNFTNWSLSSETNLWCSSAWYPPWKCQHTWTWTCFQSGLRILPLGISWFDHLFRCPLRLLSHRIEWHWCLGFDNCSRPLSLCWFRTEEASRMAGMSRLRHRGCNEAWGFALIFCSWIGLKWMIAVVALFVYSNCTNFYSPCKLPTGFSTTRCANVGACSHQLSMHLWLGPAMFPALICFLLIFSSSRRDIWCSFFASCRRSLSGGWFHLPWEFMVLPELRHWGADIDAFQGQRVLEFQILRCCTAHFESASVLGSSFPFCWWIGISAHQTYFVWSTFLLLISAGAKHNLWLMPLCWIDPWLRMWSLWNWKWRFSGSSGLWYCWFCDAICYHMFLIVVRDRPEHSTIETLLDFECCQYTIQAAFGLVSVDHLQTELCLQLSTLEVTFRKYLGWLRLLQAAIEIRVVNCFDPSFW